ncbi:nuclear transport factor 2 family protein [Flavobacterium undicola]|uniref:nuclear transport factor 2 family protein n=1 Tax=Flavobacterium undicola TaxID=1932779 RepID=UPI0013779B1B|nr:nuclear transport factor 2 family protein [Flavobacterium undicola]MBA0885277.1 nuclear transport factor 2 family protein [Flavobacterium undicola]
METQIIELEKKYWQGMENHDYETVNKLTRFPCIIAGKNGVQSVDEASFKKMFESGEGNKIKVLNFSNVVAQLVAENTAIIAYLIELGMEGDKQKPPMKCACTSTWTKENNNWVCTLHTEAELSQ